MQRELLPRWEFWLHEGAALALWLAVIQRIARGYIFTHQLWLQDSEIAVVCLLLALLYLSGCLLRRQYGAGVTAVLGAICWLAALSLLPRFGWPHWALPLWLLIYCGFMLLLAIGVKIALSRRWRGELAGHGFEWMRLWANGRAFYARLLVQRLLRSLGYTGRIADD